MEEKSFSQFVDELVSLSNKMKSPVKKLIVDLRRNSGGDSSVINPLFDALRSKRLKANEIIVLVSRQTF
jgi:C-terminal processing protease CtpA/Prc